MAFGFEFIWGALGCASVVSGLGGVLDGMVKQVSEWWSVDQLLFLCVSCGPFGVSRAAVLLKVWNNQRRSLRFLYCTLCLNGFPKPQDT